ncbi:MAG: MFS transporter [Chloroflexi bacterium]|nr:MFS transporter [Chloroflexota bacterium]
MNLLKNPRLLALALSHFTNDFYTSLLPVMFLLLVPALGLSYGQTGLVVTLSTATSSLTQPIFGYFSDRYHLRYLTMVAVLWTAASMSLVGYSENYISLILFVLSAALGSAAFHPQGAMAAGMGGGKKRSTAMAIFAVAGNTGFAVGPLIGGMVLAQTGLRGSLWLIALALFTLPVILWLSGSSPGKEQEIDTKPKVRSRNIGLLALASLSLLLMLRPWADLALVNFLALFLQTRNLPLTLASQILFLLLIGRALGMLLAGSLADRIGFRLVLLGSLLAATPVFYFFLQNQNPLILALPLGMLLGAAMPISIVLAQTILPGRSALASGLAFGSTFVAGGIGTAVTGFLADQLGLLTALYFLVPLPLLAGIVSLGIPRNLIGEEKAAPAWEVAQP